MKNKKLISLIIVIAFVLIVGPYFVGNIAKSTLEKQAEQVSKMPGYELEIREYDQGWFTSRAVIAYGFDQHTLNIMESSINKDNKIDQQFYDLLKEGLVFDVSVAHGPVTFHNGLNFALLSMTGVLKDFSDSEFQKIKQEAKIDSFLTLDTSVSYGGTTTLSANSPAFIIQPPTSNGEAVRVDFSGMDIQATINAALDEAEVDFSIQKLSTEAPTGNIGLEDITLYSSTQKLNEYLWLGKGNFNVGILNFTDPVRNNSFSITNFTSEYTLDEESDTALTMHWVSNVGHFLAGEVSINDLQLDIDMNHLNTNAVTDYVKAVQELGNKVDIDSTPKEQAAQLQVIAAQVGEEILKGSPELQVNELSFRLGKGQLNSDANLSFNGLDFDNIQQLSDPVILNKRLLAILNIRFDTAMAEALAGIGMKKQLAAGGVDISTMSKEQLDQMIKVQTKTALHSFVAQGYFKQDGDNYSTHFEMKNGEKLINGKALPIPGM